MNARKNRYAVRISETSYAEMQQKALQDGARQGVSYPCCDRKGVRMAYSALKTHI